MAFLAPLVPLVVGGLVAKGVSSLVSKKATPISAQPLPTATRDDGAAQANLDAALARRKGAAADMLTGTTGAEAAAGSTGRLVVGS